MNDALYLLLKWILIAIVIYFASYTIGRVFAKAILDETEIFFKRKSNNSSVTKKEKENDKETKK